MYNCHLDTQPGDLGPFKGCYSVTSTERSFSPRSKKRLETSKHPLNGGSGIFLFELIGINRGMIEKVGQNLSPKIKQVRWSADESHINLRGERDVIGLRNPTEDNRAFRRMLTSAHFTRQNGSIKPGRFYVCMLSRKGTSRKCFSFCCQICMYFVLWRLCDSSLKVKC